MLDFSDNMHKNQSGLELCSRPRWGLGAYSAPQTSWSKGGLLLREGDWCMEGRGRQREDSRGYRREGGPPCVYLNIA